MTVPAWNPDRFHQRMSKTPEPPRPPRRFVSGKMLALGLALVFFGAVAVTATHGADGEPERIGVCHATGSAEQPYVWLVVDKNGYEHAHHRQHAHDFFRDADAGPGSCGGDLTAEAPAGNATETDAGDAGDATETEPEGNATDAGAAPDDAGSEPTEPEENATTQPETNATEPAADGNATAANATTEPAPGDAWVRQTAAQDRFQVVLTLVVGNGGDGDATDVTLTDALPDLRRSWALSGADAEHCVLDGNDLACWFGTLAPGETATVELLAYTDRMPCGDPMTSTARVSSPGDAEARNDASSAGIHARAC